MGIGKYVANNRIAGLKPASRGADGKLVEHVVHTGDEIELDSDAAAPLLDCGAIALKPARGLALLGGQK